MLKAKKIGLILDKEVLLETTLRSGMTIAVVCEYIEADIDRLYLRFPDDKKQLGQYFYNDKTIL